MTTRQLPDDVESLKALALELFGDLDRATAKIAEQDQTISVLKGELQTLKRLIFGQSSERHVGERSNGGQASLDLEGPEGKVEGGASGTEGGKACGEFRTKKIASPRKRRCRMKFNGLERVVTTLYPDLPDHPEGYEYVEIDVDKSERLDLRPAELRVKLLRRPKIVLRKKGANIGAAEKVVNLDEIPNRPNIVLDLSTFDIQKALSCIHQAAAPEHIVVGGIPTERLLAHVAVSKYADALPLYRQQKIYARLGVDISRQTMSNWMMAVGRALQPLVDLLLERVRNSERVFADETELYVLAPGTGKTDTGYLWVYGVDNTVYGGNGPLIVVYWFEKSRAAECVIRHLGDFKGILQVDGWTAYATLVDRRDKAVRAAGVKDGDGSIKLARCWSHLRRYFVDADKCASSEVSRKTLGLMQKLWDVERDVRKQQPHIRQAAREERSKPIVAELFNLWEATLPCILQKDKLAVAINHGLNARKSFELFLDDGRIELDSNFVERNIRPQTITRKNALFCGSDGGAVVWANIATMLHTAFINGLNPETWLIETLERIANNWPIERFDELLPFKRETVEVPAAPPPDPGGGSRQHSVDAGSATAGPASSPCPQAA